MSEYLAETLSNLSLLSILMVFVAGIIASVTPCNLSTIPLLIAYIEKANGKGKESHMVKGKFILSLAFILGTATTFIVLGLLFSFLGELLGPVKEIIMYVAVVVIFLMGLILLELVPFNFHLSLDNTISKLKLNGAFGSYLFGTLMGFTTSQCATPVLLVILTFVMMNGNLLFGVLLMFAFALGRGVPILLIGTFSGIALSVNKLKRYSPIIQRLMGVMLIVFSFYLFWTA